MYNYISIKIFIYIKISLYSNTQKQSLKIISYKEISENKKLKSYRCYSKLYISIILLFFLYLN